MVKSMTGFASSRGEAAGWNWAWDIRAVNARGLDIRLRLPDWLEGLEQPTRAAVTKKVARGNVSLGLRLTRDAAEGAEQLDQDALRRAIEQIVIVEGVAKAQDLKLAKTSAAELLTARGVLVVNQPEDDSAALTKTILAALPDLLTAFDEMRAGEGAELNSVLNAQIDKIEALTAAAATLAESRKEAVAARLRENIARVLETTEAVDEGRLAQELAQIAVKSDVTEELDRLRAHVSAARELLASEEPVGRKLDFLSQEFNREANTLCSKAQSAELTAVGLDLKATIDQMREQVQNVE